MSPAVIVVGAGIAGLAAGYRLAEAGCEVTVLEAADQVGGRMSTVRRDGFILDVSGIATSRKYTAMTDLATDVGMASSIVGAPDVVAVPRHGTVHRISGTSPMSAMRTDLLSVRAKLSTSKLLVDAVRRSRHMDWSDLTAAAVLDNETVADYARRRTSPEVLEWLVDPIHRAAYMGSAETMSVVDFQVVLNQIFGAPMFTFRNGLGELPESLARRLDVRLGARATAVEESASRATVTWNDSSGEHVDETDAVVIALSAHDMAKIHPGLPAEHRGTLDELRYISLINIQLALGRRPAERALMYALPSSTHPDLCLVFLEHVKHAARAPDGAGLVTVFWSDRWNRRHLSESDDTITAATAEAVARLMPDTRGQLLWSHITRWPEAIIDSRPGTYRALRPIAQARATARRIHLAGDYFCGSTMNGALCSGEFAARQVLARRGSAMATSRP